MNESKSYINDVSQYSWKNYCLEGIVASLQVAQQPAAMAIALDDWPFASNASEDVMEQKSDGDLLESIKEGIPVERKKAFEALYNRYYLDVWRFIGSRGVENTVAKDIFAETWIVALESVHKCKEAKCLKYWLIGISKNKLREHFRKEKETKTVALTEQIQQESLTYIEAKLESSNVPPPSEKIQNQADLLILAALDRLKERDRQVILLYYFSYEEMTSAKAAQILGIRKGAVRMALSRAHKRLRREIEKSGNELGNLRGYK